MINLLNKIAIVFATNEKYAPYADVCIESIYTNSSHNYEYEITIFYTSLKEETIKKLTNKKYDNISVKCVDVSDYLAEISDKLYSHSYFSKEMYYRILIPRCFNEYEKVLYLDCDMVVLGDLSKLYFTDLEDNMIAACRNLMHTQMHDYILDKLHLDPEKYFNSGLILFNIQKCQNLENELWNIIGKYGELAYPDQDLLNLVCYGYVKYLDLSWNYLFHLARLQTSKNEALHLNETDWDLYLKTQKKIKIMHYTGDKKPWDYNALPMAEYFWKFANNSNFKEDIYNINAKTNKVKYQLQFIDFDERKIIITCCLILPRKIADSNKIIVNGNILTPNYFHIVLGTYNENYCVKKYFKTIIPTQNSTTSVYFTFNGHPILFEYGKFFPLNGIKSSYFYYRERILYRKDRELIIKNSSFLTRIKNEILYDKGLIQSKNKLARKSLLARIMYFCIVPFVKSKIILINDRPNAAGDNGEAIFRYLNNLRPKNIKTYFVISKQSHDYKRIKSIGNTAPTKSLKLKFLNLFAAAKLSSQTDREVYTIYDSNYLKDIVYKTKKVFLQHGITKDDVSELYSRYYQGFNLFITAAYTEYQSIIENKAYGCPEEITKLTGFARHDLLENKQEKIILISPTWRKYLLENVATGSIIENFKDSQFFVQYKKLFNDLQFISFLKQRGYKIYFVIHNMIRNALPDFEVFFNECVINASDLQYSELFSRCSIMVTDYSSNAFEFAYLHKPIVYFQFDRNEFFKGHTYQKGYFDYAKDGFGPVVTSEMRLKEEIIKIINNNCKLESKYEQKIDSFFAFNDKNNCERIWQEVKKCL